MEPHLLANTRGQRLMEVKRYREAASEFSKSLAALPNAEAYHGLSLALFLLRKFDEAMRTVDDGLSQFPDHSPLKQRKAFLLISFHQRDEARQLLEQLKQEDPLNPGIWFLLAQNSYMDKRISDAEKEIKQTLALTTTDPGIWKLYIQIRYDLGDYNHVKVLGGQILEHFPNEGEIHHLKSKAHIKLGEFEKAEEHTKIAATLSPTDGQITSSFDFIKEEIEREKYYQELAEEYSKPIEKKPEIQEEMPDSIEDFSELTKFKIFMFVFVVLIIVLIWAAS